MGLPKRILGKTGVGVTIMGLGGEGVLRTFGYDREAYVLINKAMDLGINYFESARAYDGSESYYNTDHLDLWQVHDVRTEEDISEIFGPGGTIEAFTEAFTEARDKGMTRFIGVTGHRDPAIVKQCMEIFDFDTVLMPVNAGEPLYEGFIREVLPTAVDKGMGRIAMKVYFRGVASQLPWFVSMEPFFRFALSQPVSLAVIGCDNLEQLEENVSFAADFTPMSAEEQERFIARISPYARQLMYYKP
jgi:aryl-alcohol dehydrogenase-like predicted oxidoreductase